MILRHHLVRSSTLRVALQRRCLSDAATERLQHPLQSYISTSQDPYLNLSIEHHLLQHSAHDSAILFLYVNRPSIIIGRNQNPWSEVNLALLGRHPNHQRHVDAAALASVDLVRRRSGGGTVFHDHGNVNWSVICPSNAFTRDKHAEMVVRALRACRVDRARVNARHDIVLDQGTRGAPTDPEDTHITPYEASDFDTPRPLKVSGSAYKLTRNRALHHATCLLSSPNLNVIPHFLRSPAKSFITARGVESVSSPVANVSLNNDAFMFAVQEHFAKQYGASSISAVEIGDTWLEDENVRKGYDELKSPEWTYLQTPQFTLSTNDQPISGVEVDLSVRYGAVDGGTVRVSTPPGTSAEVIQLSEPILGHRVHEVLSWEKVLTQDQNLARMQFSSRLPAVGKWLDRMLPRLP